MLANHDGVAKRATQASVVVPAGNPIQVDIDFYKKVGFRPNHIFPSDDPTDANMDGHGMRLTLVREEKGKEMAKPIIVVITEDVDELIKAAGGEEVVSPGGVTVRIQSYARYNVKKVDTVHKFEVRQFDQTGESPWSIGRAGMLYRDLVPTRLGGGIIASHIRIETGGPVPDFVHFHDIGFQLIFCIRGWMRLVYEDQGEPFILKAGDCVTQPPRIRHRVLESGDNLEVVEIGVPCEHMTTLDHEMELPTGRYLPDREWDGQKFCHHKKDEATYEASRLAGFEHRDTGVGACTKQVAGVKVLRPLAGTAASEKAAFHDADIHFSFVMEGSLEMEVEGEGTHCLGKGAAVTVPPKMKHRISKCSADLEILEISLRGDFNTTVA